jgi:hypothetical protein
VREDSAVQGLVADAPMTALLCSRGALNRHPFVLIDVGCAGGIDDDWRAVGPTLVARVIDVDVAACSRAM